MGERRERTFTGDPFERFDVFERFERALVSYLKPAALVVPIRVVGLAQFRRPDNLRGDVVPPVHHMEVHVAVETLQRMANE
jgi:hypothetical protein